MLYQPLSAAWPFDPHPGDAAPFRDRVWGFWEKSIREAKLRSEWAAPDGAYEEACRNFLDGVFDESRATATVGEIIAFAKRIGPAGAINGLAQTVLKYTVPGVPDLYQGTEFWDLSLVDPDNRRPVDFAARKAGLGRSADVLALLADWTDGRIKQNLIAKLLACRNAHPALFAEGDYAALEISGARAGHALAFSRTRGERRLVVAVSRLATGLLGDTGLPLIPGAAWGDSAVLLADQVDRSWHDVLQDRPLEGGAAAFSLARLLASLPVAVLVTGSSAG
jgi:(1->4)-alpha-D-glucan 1-alpha-D-glucosylmutase